MTNRFCLFHKPMHMKKTLPFVFILLLTITVQNTFAQKVITLPVLLKEMTDFDAVANYPSPTYTIKQASSYDRRSVSPDKPGWFANSDANQFIREEKKDGRTELVMMDADGPGAIVRFWLTTVVKPGTMRFYFDNEDKASLEIPGFDLMKGFILGPGLLNPHSSYEPNGKGGNTLYLPLLYQKHCKITWENPDTNTAKQSHYYQVNYRTYTPGTQVETFAVRQLKTYKVSIDQAEARLWNPTVPTGKQVHLNQTLATGKDAAVVMPQGPNAIKMISLQLTTPDKANQESMWRQVFVKMEFDGNQTVLCPLGDFIGSGYGGKPIKSWYRSLAADGQLTSRWVMPYAKQAKITFINKAPFTVTVNADITITSFNFTSKTMYFHATYKYEANVKDVKWDYDLTKVALRDTAAPIDWNFATIKGKGIYLGNTLAVNNHMNSWYGEGDAKAYVDNEKFPSEFGTGLEDYYNTSWAPVVLYQSPFANAPRADNPSSKGYNTFTRTRALDGIPFTKAFAFDLEMLSWDGGTIDAAATTYWYGFAGASDR